MKKWTFNYENEEIVVVNKAFSAELIVNGSLQDSCLGVSACPRLEGKLECGKAIKANLGGVFSVGCDLFVDNLSIAPTSVQRK